MYDNSERDPRLNVPEILANQREGIIGNALRFIQMALNISETSGNTLSQPEEAVVTSINREAARERRNGGNIVNTAITTSELENANTAVEEALKARDEELAAKNSDNVRSTSAYLQSRRSSESMGGYDAQKAA